MPCYTVTGRLVEFVASRNGAGREDQQGWKGIRPIHGQRAHKQILKEEALTASVTSMTPYCEY